MPLRRCFATAWVLLASAGGAGLAQDAPPNRPKLFYPPCAPFAPGMPFDCYHNYAEVTRFLHDAAARYPGFASVETLGKSYEGRDLWLITITELGAGAPEDKPAIWVDGGIDADEVIATEAALGLVHRLLTSDDPRVQLLRRTKTFYIAPAVIPDASELHHGTPERPRDTTLRPWDDDGDGEADEDGVEDLDGDHQALQMRRRDAGGDMVLDESDPRLMRARRPGDEGPFYTVYSEGIDNDGDGAYNEDRLGGIDPNRNYPGNWSQRQRGSGPFAGSELELRAMLDFVAGHPNIAASQHFHSSGGVVLRPPSVPDMTLPDADLELYQGLARRGLEVTGYALATSVFDWSWPEGTGNRKRTQIWRDAGGTIRGWPVAADDGAAYPAYGGSIDALYELFGVLAFANEIYQMGDDTDGDGRVEPTEQLAYNDGVLEGAAFKEWTAFEHPQLGPVEIGGWRKFGQNNPVGTRLADEVRRNVEFALMQAAHTPDLELAAPSVEDLGNGVFRVTITVRNAGYQPTELAVRRQAGRALAVKATIDPGSDVELLSSQAEVSLGTLDGYSEREVEWVVRSSGGGSVTVTARHPKGGRETATVELRR